MDNLLERAVSAVVKGIIVGVVVALLLLIISALIPDVSLDAGKWGAIAGVLAALYTFVTGRDRV